MYLEDDQFNQFLPLAIQRSIQSDMNIVDLMRVFNDAKAAIGCCIKAAYHCPTFLQFLDKNKRKVLKKYKKEQEEDDRDNHSNP